MKPFRPLQPQDNLFDGWYYDALVPDDHELMQIDRHVDFRFIEGLVGDCYSDHPAGQPPIPPERMLRLCFLKEYLNLSDDQLMQQCGYNLLYRKFVHLTGNELLPDASSMTRFRNRIGEERLKGCLDQVVAAAAQLGLVDNQRVHVDSTGIVADIAISRLRGLALQAAAEALEGLAALRQDETAAPLRAQWQALVADNMYWQQGPEHRDAHVLACWELLGQVGDVYDGLMQGRGWAAAQEELILQQAAQIEKVLQRREGRQGTEKRDCIASVQDPDARYNNREKGKKPYAGYKEHVIEDDTSGIITEVIVTPANVDDSTQLQGLVGGHEANVGMMPESLAADSKYFTARNLEHLDTECIEGFIAVPAAKGEKQGLFGPADFEYDAAHDCVMCPAGEIAEGGKWKQQAEGFDYYFRKGQCQGCALRDKCSTQKRGRTVFISTHRETLLAARAVKDDPEHLAAQRRRLRIEKTFALQKQRHGLRRTRYRGLSRVRMGVYFNVLVVNLRRIVQALVSREEQAQGPPPRLLAQAA